MEPLAAVEYEYSMWWREIETTILPVLEELEIGLVAYSPLGRGFLTGKLSKDMSFSENDNRAELPRFQKEAMEANQIVIEFIETLAKEKQATPAQIALAWITAQKPYIVPIPGTTKVERMQENIAAININFTEQEMNQINDVLNKMTIVGDRYPESEKKRVGN